MFDLSPTSEPSGIDSPNAGACERLYRGDMVAKVKDMIRDFLKKTGYRSPHTSPNPQLRAEVTSDLVSWVPGLNPAVVYGLMDTGCTIAESAYAHTSHKHQLMVALYTAYMTYVDDLAGRDLEAVGKFGEQFVAREDPADPALRRLVQLLQEMYVLYPRLSADAITAGTLDAFVGEYVELSTKGTRIAPGASGYPVYLRRKTANGGAYALFLFMKGWRDPADTYHLQLVPNIEHYIWSINDILSFYKELLNGETNTYVHTRAAAEQKDLLAVLHEVCEEALKSTSGAQALSCSDPQLAEICNSYLMGYIEFHFRAERYRLADLEIPRN